MTRHKLDRKTKTTPDEHLYVSHFPSLSLPLSDSPGEEEELGPPPTVDEAADALMTRLGFLLGEKIVSGEPGSPYHAQDDGQVITGSLAKHF